MGACTSKEKATLPNGKGPSEEEQRAKIAEMHRQATITKERAQNGGLTNHETALRQHFVSSYFLGSSNMTLMSSVTEFVQSVLKARSYNQKVVVALFKLECIDTERHLAFLRQTADTCAKADRSYRFAGCQFLVVMEPALEAVAVHLGITQTMLGDQTNQITDGIMTQNVVVNLQNHNDVYPNCLIYRAHVGYQGENFLSGFDAQMCQMEKTLSLNNFLIY